MKEIREYGFKYLVRAPKGGPLPIDFSEDVGLGVLDLLCNSDEFGELKQQLAIDADSTVLFFNTEGATDPESYREIVWHGKYPSPA